jgi:hypothetical protein
MVNTKFFSVKARCAPDVHGRPGDLIPSVARDSLGVLIIRHLNKFPE